MKFANLVQKIKNDDLIYEFKNKNNPRNFRDYLNPVVINCDKYPKKALDYKKRFKSGLNEKKKKALVA